MRNLVVVLGVFLFLAVLLQTNLDFTEPITEYVTFVITTDFSMQAIIENFGFLEKLTELNPGSWFESWIPVSSGW